VIVLWKCTSVPVAPLLKGQGAIPPKFHRSLVSLKLPMMLLCKGTCAPAAPHFQRPGRAVPPSCTPFWRPWESILLKIALSRFFHSQSIYDTGSDYFTWKFMLYQFFFKENVRYPVWTCNMGPDFSDSRDPIFSDSRDPMIICSDSRDPIFNSRDPNRVPKTP